MDSERERLLNELLATIHDFTDSEIAALRAMIEEEVHDER